MYKPIWLRYTILLFSHSKATRIFSQTHILEFTYKNDFFPGYPMAWAGFISDISILVDIDIWTRNDSFDDAFSVLTFPWTRHLERSNSIFESKPDYRENKW